MREFEIRKIKLKTGNKTGNSSTLSIDSIDFKEYYYRSICVILDNYHAIVNELDFTLEEIFNLDLSHFQGEEAAFKKWRLWSLKINTIPRIKSTTKELRRDTKSALLKRNKYIHGTLHYQNNVPYLKYNEKDDTGNIINLDDPLSHSYIQEDIDFMRNIKDSLRELNTAFISERNSEAI